MNISYNTIHGEIRRHIIITLFKTQESISICSLCGKVFWHTRWGLKLRDSIEEIYINHMRDCHSEWLNAYWAQKYRIPKHIKPTIRRIPLKPWKDPESLFCDTEFLKDILGKEPRHGEECTDKRI